MTFRNRVDLKATSRPTRAMTPRTCKAARALLALGQIALAEKAGVAVQTLRNFENEETVPSLATWLKIKRALQRAGIQFIEDDGSSGAGLRLKHAERPK